MPPRLEGSSMTTLLSEIPKNTEAIPSALTHNKDYVAKNDPYSHSHVRKVLSLLIVICFVLFLISGMMLAGLQSYVLFPFPAAVFGFYVIIQFAQFLLAVRGWIKAYRRKSR